MHLRVALFCVLVAPAWAGAPTGSVDVSEYLDKSGAQKTNRYPVNGPAKLSYDVPGAANDHGNDGPKDVAPLYSPPSRGPLGQSNDATLGSGGLAKAVASPEIRQSAEGAVERAPTTVTLTHPLSPFLYYPGPLYHPPVVPYHPVPAYPYVPYVIPARHPFHPAARVYPVEIFPQTLHPRGLFPDFTYLPPLPPPPAGYPPLPPLPGSPQLPPSPRPLPPQRQPGHPQSPFPPTRLPPPQRPTLLPPPRTPSRPVPPLPPSPIPPPRRQPFPSPRPLPRPQPQPQPRPQPLPQPRPQPRPQPLPQPRPQPRPLPQPHPQPHPQPQPQPQPQPHPPQRPATEPRPVPIPEDGGDEIANPQSDPPVLSAENAPAHDPDDAFRRGFLPSPAARRRLADTKTSDLNEPQPINQSPTFAYNADQEPRV